MDTHRTPVNETTTRESARPTPSEAPDDDAGWEPPGGILIWIVVFLELITFGGGLVVFMVHGRHEVDSFRSGRALLNQPIALANTLLLLTGGWCMANAIVRLRSGLGFPAARWIGGAIFTGIAFLLLKCVEYAEKLNRGIGFGDDPFFTLYWLLTGFHLLHVAFAVVLLLAMWSGIRREKYHAGNHLDVESSGIFWHLCDLIWLLLYPIVYLLR